MAANNHYARFGPATANSFRKMLGLREVAWDEYRAEKIVVTRLSADLIISLSAPKHWIGKGIHDFSL